MNECRLWSRRLGKTRPGIIDAALCIIVYRCINPVFCQVLIVGRVYSCGYRPVPYYTPEGTSRRSSPSLKWYCGGPKSTVQQRQGRLQELSSGQVQAAVVVL